MSAAPSASRSTSIRMRPPHRRRCCAGRSNMLPTGWKVSRPISTPATTAARAASVHKDDTITAFEIDDLTGIGPSYPVYPRPPAPSKPTRSSTSSGGRTPRRNYRARPAFVFQNKDVMCQYRWRSATPSPVRLPKDWSILPPYENRHWIRSRSRRRNLIARRRLSVRARASGGFALSFCRIINR